MIRMNMKKRTLLTTLFLLILSVGVANAQLSDWRFRVDASVNFSKGDYKIEKVNDLTTKAIVGYRIGGAVNVPFSSMLYFAPGITFLSKGSKTTIKDRNFGDVKTRTHHIEIPLHVGLRVPIGETLAFNVQFGPYLSYAIAGTAKTDNNKDIDIFKDGIKDMWKEKRFDVGLGAAAMVDINKIYVLLGADFGMLDQAKSLAKDKETTLKNTSFHLGLGYRF